MVIGNNQVQNSNQEENLFQLALRQSHTEFPNRTKMNYLLKFN